MNRPNVKNLVAELLRVQQQLTNRELVQKTGLSRQAVAYQLRNLVSRGLLEPVGQGRSRAYRLASGRQTRWSFKALGLQEDAVWNQLIDEVPALRSLPGQHQVVFQYAVTELINNAIEHASAGLIQLVLLEHEQSMQLTITDDGVGIFEHIRRNLGQSDHLSALQDLSKGKLTTDLEHHTGEGIFFCSRVADVFEISSARLRWVVDNIRDDTGVLLLSEVMPGTEVRFQASVPPRRGLEDTFTAYTEDFEFSRTRVVVKLFEMGERFISRSEARRLMTNLDRFKEVILDFHGVAGVGQGFADEVFRVWARSHPEVTLKPVRMNRAVEFMIKRALP